MYKVIPVSGTKALVDAADYDRVMALSKWYLRKTRNTSYVVSEPQPTGSPLYLHRVIMENELAVEAAKDNDDLSKRLYIDHINHDGLDNRKDNLRVCNTKENQYNRRPVAGNSFKGVRWDKHRQLWSAWIYVNKKRITLGYFKDEITAAMAYDVASLQHHKEFAYCNLPYGDGVESTFIGITWDHRLYVWVAQIAVSGITHNLGNYKNELDAANAYDNGVRKYLFAGGPVNFPKNRSEDLSCEIGTVPEPSQKTKELCIAAGLVPELFYS